MLDGDGRVVGVTTRADMRAGALWHRCVFVAVITPGDELLVHRRADDKDVWPSRWDLCFGGVVAAGEGWEHAAMRELAEEAGLTVGPDALTALGEGRFERPEVRERYRLYLVRSGGPFRFVDGEVAAVELVPRAGLAAWCAAHEVVPDSEEIAAPVLRTVDRPAATG